MRLLVVLGILLAVLAAIALLIRWLRRQNLLKEAGRELIATYWLARCYLYMSWLGVSLPARRFTLESVAFVLLAASLFGLLEAIGLLLPKIHLPKLPAFLIILIILLAVLMVRHRMHEWRRSRRRLLLLAALRSLMANAIEMDFSGSAKQNRLASFLDETLVAFKRVFDEHTPVGLSLMARGDKQKPFRLAHIYPEDAGYDPEFTVPEGEGGAGKAAAGRRQVYIPAIKYLHGISIDFPAGNALPIPSYALAKNAYLPTPRHEPFATILCVPVPRKEPADDIRMVLNVTAARRNAFGEFDFYLGEVAAGFIAVALDKFERTP